MIKTALSSLNKHLERKSEFRQLSGSDLKALIQKQTIKSTFVSKGSRVCKTSAQSPKTIKSSLGPRARALEVRAGEGVEA
jgi:hypothetical protein